MAYLSITDGRIARYDSSISPDLEGFYTDNFSSCNIVILYQQTEDNIRISMIHADCSTTTDDIKNELAWIGATCKRIIVRRQANEHSEMRKKDVLGELIDSFDEQFCPINKTGISVNSNGEITFYGYEELPELIVHPQEWRLNCIYKLNSQFEQCQTPPEVLQNTKLLFDASDWVSLSKHDVELLPIANDFFEYFSKNGLDDFSKIGSVVRTYIKANYNLRMLSYEPQDNDYIIAIYAFQLATDNDYKKMFSERLRAMLKDGDFSHSEKVFLREVLSNEYDEGNKLIAQGCSEELRNTIFRCLNDIYILCHHARAEKRDFFLSKKTEEDEKQIAPANTAPNASFYLTTSVTRPNTNSPTPTSEQKFTVLQN